MLKVIPYITYTYSIKKYNNMILKFTEFIKEELRISQINDKTLHVLKQNIKDRLIEYKTYILSNVTVVGGKAVFKDFDTIETNIILRELNNEFTPEFIKELKIEELLNKIQSFYSEKDRYIKKKIRKTFRKYFEYLETIKK